MDSLGKLPAWAVMLLALVAGTGLIRRNYGWLPATRDMLGERRLKDGSMSAASPVDRSESSRSSGQ
jgi:hypothetical protein